MTWAAASPHPPAWLRAAGLFVMAAVVYLGVPRLTSQAAPRGGHFARLADAFMRGSVSFELRPEDLDRLRVGELIPATPPGDAAAAGAAAGDRPPAVDASSAPQGTPAARGAPAGRDVSAAPRAYCGYPPFPAVVMIPFMLLLGEAARVDIVTRLISALNVVLLDVCLRRLHGRFGIGPASGPSRLALVFAFAFGTATWHNADTGGDWHLAHAVALMAMLAALCEHTGRGRPGVIGLFVAAALMTRPTAALTGLMFAWPRLRAGRDWRGLLTLALAPAGALVLLGAYNAVRFGDPLDFGYDRMFLAGLGRALIDRFGQFHPVFIRRNFFWFFLAPPLPTPELRFPFVGFSPFGMSLFLVSPLMIYILVAIRRRHPDAQVVAAAWAAAVCLAPLLLYYNTGYWQFGHRFSMDYTMPLVVLVAAGVGPRPSRRAYVLAAASIAIHVWGIILEPVVHVRDFLLPAVPSL